MKIRRIARNIFVWSYERGTLQYDIICVLILAFIFLVPPRFFNADKPDIAKKNNKEAGHSSSDDPHKTYPGKSVPKQQ